MGAHNHRQLTLRLVALVAFLAAGINCPGFSKDQWQMYNAPHGDFKLMVPGPVEVKKQKLGGSTAQNYMSQGDEHNACLIACELQDDKEIFEKFADGARGGITGKGGQITRSEDVSGPGWSGHLYDYSKENDPDSSLLVAKVDDSGVYYTIAMNASSQSKEGKSLFSSFEVDPANVTSPITGEKASSGKSSSDSSSSTSDSDSDSSSSGKDKGPWYNLGAGIGILLVVLFGLGFLLVPIAIILLIVFVVKRSDKKGN